MLEPFLVHEQPVAGPATHAMIIGVGDYPHLNGGTGPLTADHDGMGQLSSPPLSARAIASWLLTSFHHPQKPLSTISLLLSEPGASAFDNPRTNVAHVVRRATSASADQAITAWKARGDTDARNLMLFYFCGHGISEGVYTALLLSDYGADPQKALDGALDFRRLWLGLNRCRATEQCFFIDACRTASGSLGDADGFAGKVVIQPGRRNAGWERPVRAPIFYATFDGARAYGFPDKPSLYAQALVKALAGWGADDDDGTWRVTTNRVGEALEQSVARKAREFDRLQLPTADGMTKIYLHHLSGEPTAPVYVTSQPPLAPILGANLTYGATGGALGPAPPSDPSAADWTIETSLGTYDFSATFPDGQRIGATGVSVRPPYKAVVIRAGATQ